MTNSAPLMTVDRLDELMRAVFEELVRRDGTAHGREALEAVAARVELTEVERALNTGNAPRWETNIRFHSTDCVRAGYLQKKSGYWTITDVGREALKLPPGQLIRSAQKAYRRWHAAQRDAVAGRVETIGPSPVAMARVDVAPPDPAAIRRESFERAEEAAQEGIEAHLFDLNPYEFQDLIAHLLTAMGYFVAHNAPPGPDGGVDLIVYKDPLGTVTPRIKVQVKHRASAKVTVKEIRELQGLLQGHDEVGLMVSTGGFTSDAERESRASGRHVDMIGLTRLVDLWVQHYARVTEEGRAMLPLAPVWFITPGDD